MKFYLKTMFSATVSLMFCTSVNACAKVPEKPGTDPETDGYPDRSIYSDAIFSMDEVPADEPASDIAFREARLSARTGNFYASLDNAIASGNISGWLQDYYDEYSSEIRAAEPYTVLILQVMDKEKYADVLKPYIVDILRENIPVNIETFREESEKDKAAGQSGLIRDLNTVHPVRYILESAWGLRLLGEYDAGSEAAVRNFIEENIENQVNYYQGSYGTTGYNKEIFAMDIAFWVKMLYGDAYPVTERSFERIWTNVTAISYDADNSPHYDSGTGFYLILRWGLFLNRIEDMRNSIHIRRIIDRMARTVHTSGQCMKWGKSMENIYSSDRELAIDGGRTLAWCLKVGYLLYQDPSYLYIARKYEDLRYNSLNITRWKGIVCDLWPEGINFDGISAFPDPDFGTVHVTERITSNVSYEGINLGRYDSDWKTVQDKIVLSTGTHPNAPSMLIDLSYTQSKAAWDHRISIGSYMFMSSHIASVLGRPGEPFRINRPYVASSDMEDFPVFKVAQGDVDPTAQYEEMLGYSSKFDYVIDEYTADRISPEAAYCNISYSKYEYEGVSVRRQVVLLHNGVSVIFDEIANNGQRSLNSATIYAVWPSVIASGEKWVVQEGHVPTTVSMPAYGEIPVLFAFPQTDTPTTMRVETDELRSSFEKGRTKTLILQSDDTLENGGKVEMLTVIAPLKSSRNAGAFAEHIDCEKVAEGWLLYLPSPDDKAIKVLMTREGKPMVNDN